MYIEQEGLPVMENELSISAFFLCNEVVVVNLEDGRYVEIDRYGNFTVYSNEDTVIQSNNFSCRK